MSRLIPLAALAALPVACASGRVEQPSPSTEAYREARGMLKEMSPAGTVAEQAERAVAENLYLAGLWHYEELRYQKALEYFERAVRADLAHHKAREYLKKTKAILDVNSEKMARVFDSLSKGRVRIAGLLTEIDKGLEKAREHRSAAERYDPKTDAELPREKLLLRAIENYGRCVMQCDRVLEIVRWMPYKVDLSGRKQQAQALREEARKALDQKKRELETLRRAQGLKSEAGEGGGKDEEGSIPWEKRLVYPPHWVKILYKGEKGSPEPADEPEWKRAMRKQMDRRVTFDLKEKPFSKAIDQLQALTKVRMILDPKARKDEVRKPVTLKVSDIELGLALKWMCRLAGVDYLLRKDGVFIARPENLAGTVELREYDVRDLLAKAPPANAGYITIDGEKAKSQATSSLAEMIRSRIMPDTWAAELGASIEERGGQLVVMQRPRVHKLIEELLAILRKSEKLKVVAGGGPLEVRDEFLEEIGVQFADEQKKPAKPKRRSWSSQIIPSFVWDEIAARTTEGDEHREKPAWKRDMRRQMRRRVTFEFEDTPVEEAISFLQTLCKVGVVLDPATFRGADAAADKPVTLKVTDTPFDEALGKVLALAGLDYALKHEAIFISTPENLASEVDLKIYDVRDLVDSYFKWTTPPMVAEKKPGEVSCKDLAKMIRERVRPDSWSEKLGTSIEAREGRLVVMQRPDVHKLIEKLLASFRERQKLLREVEKQFEKARREKKPTSSP